MFRRLVRSLAVQIFGLAVRLGLNRIPAFNRAFLASYAAYKHYFEAGPIDRLREFIPGKSLVIDVGANVGFFSLRFARWVGDDGKVISIEPEDRNYDSLISVLERNGLASRVEALKAVVAAAPGKMFLRVDPLHPADHRLSQDNTGLPVDAVTLDELVRTRSGLTPSLIKIDVQGAELLVLQGSAETLKTFAPALFIELHEEGLQRFGTSVAAVLAHLSAYGYQTYWLMQRGPHRPAGAEEIGAEVARLGYVDVLFLKPPRAG